jgi:hypothetical protein
LGLKLTLGRKQAQSGLKVAISKDILSILSWGCYTAEVVEQWKHEVRSCRLLAFHSRSMMTRVVLDLTMNKGKHFGFDEGLWTT